MKITRKENYIIIRDENKDFEDFATKLSQHHRDFENENVVIDILEKKHLKAKDMLLFLEISNLHRNQKKSFVIACDAEDISIDNIPEDLIVVPTLREAEDMVNMEDLEREIGF